MFVTHVTQSQTKDLKSKFLYQCRVEKKVKSTHLDEAIANAFGEKTNASLRARFDVSGAKLCVEVRAERFWNRLAELAEISLDQLKERVDLDFDQALSSATGIRSLMQDVDIPAGLQGKLESFFLQMAENGPAYLTVSGFEKPGMFGMRGLENEGHAMRPVFNNAQAVPFHVPDSDIIQGLREDLRSQEIAGAFLESDRVLRRALLQWSFQAERLLPRELSKGNVVFHSELGLVVQHNEIDGCKASVLYQRPGQLADVKRFDELQRQKFARVA